MRALALVALGLAVVIGGGLRLRGTRAAPPGAVAVATGAAPAESPPAVVPRRPASLRGTRPDGALATDATGRLVPGPDVRRYFDYFLSAAGEEPPEAIRARIVRGLERRLSPDAARQATDLLDRYLAYRERARLLDADPAMADLDARFATLRALRREVLGAEAAEAFFASEEAEAQAALARRRVLTDPAVSPAERDAALAAVEAALPDDLRQARAAAVAPLQLMQDEQALRDAGAPEDAVRALREQAVGPEAADRLAALDAERAAWQQRVDDYRAARHAIDENAHLSDAERARAVAALRAERFSPTEQVRIEALDRIAGN